MEGGHPAQGEGNNVLKKSSDKNLGFGTIVCSPPLLSALHHSRASTTPLIIDKHRTPKGLPNTEKSPRSLLSIIPPKIFKPTQRLRVKPYSAVRARDVATLCPKLLVGLWAVNKGERVLAMRWLWLLMEIGYQANTTNKWRNGGKLDLSAGAPNAYRIS